MGDAKAINVGDSVEARYGGRGKWVNAKVRKVNDNDTYDLKYDDGRRERGVKKKYVRKKENEDSGKGKQSKKQKKKTKKRDGEDTNSSSSDDSSAMSDEEDAKAINVGDSVEARYGGRGKWVNAKVRKVNDNDTYDLKYDDGRRER